MADVAMLDRLRRIVMPERPPGDLVWLTPEIAQSGRFSSGEARALTQYGIGAVLDLRPDERHDLATLGKAGLHYLYQPVAGQAALTESDLARAADWSQQELGDDRRVLVQAAAGSQAGLVVIAAVLLRAGVTLEEAAALVWQQPLDAVLSGPATAALQSYAGKLAR